MRRWCMQRAQRTVQKVDYSPAAQQHAHLGRLEMRKSDAEMTTLLADIESEPAPGQSKKWELADAPSHVCDGVAKKEGGKCGCKNGGAKSQVACTLFRNYMGWPSNREQSTWLFTALKKKLADVV